MMKSSLPVGEGAFFIGTLVRKVGEEEFGWKEGWRNRLEK